MTTFEPNTISVTLPITFRAAEEEDLPNLEWYGQYTHFRRIFRRAYREQLIDRRLLLLADCNGFPIGHIFIQFISDNERIADGKERSYFYSLRVMEMFRQKGIGTQLIREAEKTVTERGFRQVTIAVAKDNANALRLYEKLGYVKFAQDPGRWSYRDHEGNRQFVEEPCWILEKNLHSV